MGNGCVYVMSRKLTAFRYVFSMVQLLLTYKISFVGDDDYDDVIARQNSDSKRDVGKRIRIGTMKTFKLVGI